MTDDIEVKEPQAEQAPEEQAIIVLTGGQFAALWSIMNSQQVTVPLNMAPLVGETHRIIQKAGESKKGQEGESQTGSIGQAGRRSQMDSFRRVHGDHSPLCPDGGQD